MKNEASQYKKQAEKRKDSRYDIVHLAYLLTEQNNQEQHRAKKNILQRIERIIIAKKGFSNWI